MATQSDTNNEQLAEFNRFVKLVIGEVVGKEVYSALAEELFEHQRRHIFEEHKEEFVGATRKAIRDGILSVLNDLWHSHGYDHEVKSEHGYYSGYTRPVEVPDQIAILRSHWPILNPDRAMRYYREVYPTFQFPEWVEGPFAIIRPGFFSDKYEEEIEAVMKAIVKDRNGEFADYTWNFLRRNDLTLSSLQSLTEQQPCSDILISAAQFGIRHRGRSANRAREVFVAGEYGMGVKDAGTMLLTSPVRLRHYDDLWIECAGDEFVPLTDDDVRNNTLFRFNRNRVEFSNDPYDDAHEQYGSASAFLPAIG